MNGPYLWFSGRPVLRSMLGILLSPLLLAQAGPAALSPGEVEHRPAPAVPELHGHRLQNPGLPLRFEANQGQAAPSIDFLGRGSAYHVLVAQESLTVLLNGLTPVRVGLGGAAGVVPTGTDRLASVAHYLVGKEPRGWVTHVPEFATVRYTELYPGIDLVLAGDDRGLRLQFVVAPGASVESIALEIDGTVERDGAQGALLRTENGELRLGSPVFFYESDGGRAELTGQAVLRSRIAIGYTVEARDETRAVTVAVPVLIEAEDSRADTAIATDVDLATDKQGNAYIAGRLALPQQGGAWTAGEAVVTKLAIDSSAIAYSTYFGGRGDDVPRTIALDGKGRVVIAGSTGSHDFPLDQENRRSGPTDAFVAALAADGASFEYAVVLGGTGADEARSIAADAWGDVWVTGRTEGMAFPTTQGAFQVEAAGPADAFVAALDPAGEIAYASLLGGAGDDSGQSIAVHHVTGVWLTGATSSADFPMAPTAEPSLTDAFVARLDPRAGMLLETLRLGGAGDDAGLAIAALSDGGVMVAGRTTSVDFPLVGGLRTVSEGTGSRALGGAFVARVGPDGATLASSSYAGGPGDGQVNALAVDDKGWVWLAGTSDRRDGFVVRLDPDGTRRPEQRRLGGEGDVTATGLAVGPEGVLVSGTTGTRDLPQLEALTPSHDGGRSYLTQLDELAAGCPGTINFDNGAGTGQWDNAANWDTNTLPSATDDVCIGSFAVTILGTHAPQSIFVVNAGSLTIAAGGLSLAAASQIDGSFALTAGTLSGAGTLTVNGAMSWTGGEMNGAGLTEAAGSLNISGAGSKRLISRTLKNSGTATWTGTGPILTGSAALIDNTGSWDNQNSDVLMFNGLGGPISTFRNAGTFKKSAGAGPLTLQIVFNNQSAAIEAVDVQAGTLVLQGGGTHTGSFDLTGATLGLSGGTHNFDGGSKLSGGGTVKLPSGTVNFNAGSLWDTGGAVELSGSALTVNPGSAISIASLTMTAGSLGGTGTVTVSGAMSWTGGEMNGAGLTDAAGSLSISGAGSKRLISRTLKNSGTAIWTGTGPIHTGSAALIDNTGSWDNQNSDVLMFNGLGGPMSTFRNAGTFKKSAGAGPTTIGLPFTSSGAVQALTGTLKFTQGYTQTAGSTVLNGGALESATAMDIQGGTLTGAGTITAPSVNSSGLVSPGLSPGTLAASGGYVQSSSGSFDVEASGTGCTANDLLVVGGTATLSGTLNGRVTNGCIPDAPTTFTILTAGSVSGTFAAVTEIPEMACNIDWNVIYNPGSVVLEAVPGPCLDPDGDGFVVCCGGCFLTGGRQCGECDDTHPLTHPGAASNDNPTACMRDVDGDNYGDPLPPAGVAPGTDCDETDASTHPGAAPNDNPTACMRDADGDDYGSSAPPAGVASGTDCDDALGAAWARPGETRSLRFQSETALSWVVPSAPGGTLVRYDTLRSDVASDFMTSAICLESDDASDTAASEPQAPVAGNGFYYLIGAENDCPNGQGSLGFGTDGEERLGRTCP